MYTHAGKLLEEETEVDDSDASPVCTSARPTCYLFKHRCWGLSTADSCRAGPEKPGQEHGALPAAPGASALRPHLRGAMQTAKHSHVWGCSSPRLVGALRQHERDARPQTALGPWEEREVAARGRVRGVQRGRTHRGSRGRGAGPWDCSLRCPRLNSRCRPE